jgi:prophage regulatory protein
MFSLRVRWRRLAVLRERFFKDPTAQAARVLEWCLSSNDFNTRMETAMTIADSILRLPAVKARVGLSRSAIYLAVSRAEFPPPVQLGSRAVGWLESEIDEWIRERIERSRRRA